MIIQHNIMAINSHRQLGINNSSLSKNLEKLSSGYRINRAADDAAGLAISEKMRAQITGLDRAVLNAQDGASLIQTAEGALQEVHSMLNRMVELATQSANGTIQADDRQKIEAEVEALKEEIDRISESTNFNGIKLLDGSLSESGVRDINVENLNLTYTNAVAGTYRVTVGTGNVNTNLAKGDVIDYVIGLDDGTSMTFKFTVGSSDGTKADQLIAEDGSVYAMATDKTLTSNELTTAIMGEMSDDKSIGQKFEVSHTANQITFTAAKAGTSAPQIVSAGGTLTKADGTANPAAITGAALSVTAGPADAFRTGETKVFTGANEMESVFSVNGVKFAFVKGAGTAADEAIQDLIDKGVNVVYTAGDTATAAETQNMANLINQKTGLNVTPNATAGSLDFKAVAGTGAGLTMQVGDTADDYQKITVNVDNMSSSGLGISGVSMATQESAAAALDAVKSAIEKVSVNRGNLGALQNRLEHTINNLNVTSENMTAAESRIRDVDMAKEMMAFTKNNVLAQAAQAMLAQANQQPQQVLQLLR